MKNKKGFTLVELLAVIVILAIILVIAVPKVMSVIEDSKKATLESTAKMIASAAEKAKVQNTVLGKEETITCDSVAKINKLDYETCEVVFEDNTAKVSIKGSGKFAGLYICGGTKTDSNALNTSCSAVCGKDEIQKVYYKYEVDDITSCVSTITEKLNAVGETSLVAAVESVCNGQEVNGYNFDNAVNMLINSKLFTEEELIENNVMKVEEEKVCIPSKATNAVEYIKNIIKNENSKEVFGLIKDNTEDQNIRYAGATANVKNKVYFNCTPTDGTNAYGSENYNYESSCELWRIIGVFKTYEDKNDTEGDLRIKIVRDQVLGTSMKWNTAADGVDYINQWGPTTLTSDNTTPYAGASLMQYLNGDYHNSLTIVAKGQIDEVLWYTGAVADGTASGVYEGERSNATGTGTTVNYTTIWVGKIGLIYTSDFGYAGTNCGDKTIFDYNKSCGLTSNWLTLSSSSYWSISPGASNSHTAWNILGEGFASDFAAHFELGVRPALYLDSNIQIIGGEGVDGNAYKLSA